MNGISAAYRAQGDALLIESQAKIRLADEYDAAQERDEIKKAGNPNSSRTEELPGTADVGLTYKQVHEARQIRDAETANPGIVRRTVDKRVAARTEPTKEAIRVAVRPHVVRPREPLWTPADIIPFPRRSLA